MEIVQGAELTVRNIGDKSIEGIPELKTQKVILFVKDLSLIKKEAKLVRPPYSIIIEGRYGVFVGPVSFDKRLFGNNVWDQRLEDFGKKMQKYRSVEIKAKK